MNPTVEYERRRGAYAAESLGLESREKIAGRSRLVAFFAIFLPFLFLAADSWPAILIGSFAVLVFIVVVIWHRRVSQRQIRSRRAVRYFERCLDRLNDRWIGNGLAGERYADPAHPNSSDLDLFGRGSLFQYLCDAHTPVGQDTLAHWLMHPADPDTIRARQAAVAELRPNLDLRKALGILGDPQRAELKTRALLTWPEMPPVLTGKMGPIIAIVLGLLGLGGIITWAGFGTGPSPLLAVAIVQVIFVSTQWGRIREVTRDARTVLAELEAFLPVLRLVERHRGSCRLLQEIHHDLFSEGAPPSRRVAHLARLLDAWETSLRNQFVLPLAFVAMVPMHLIYAIERWRLRDGRRVRAWLNAVGSFEAIASFATFAYEHPEYSFPEIVADGPLMEAESLAHPLLPAARRVANDVSLGKAPALLLVSGSNMSGKSTLMRAVGVNIVLALAGSPVCASTMRVSPMMVATSMRQGDSLQEGVSAFYAEIRRLQAIREWTHGPRPVFFLLDEVLRGTNSHDRRIGAEAVIEALLRGGALGMVSTHDLALAAIVDQQGPRAANVHFEDQVADGKVTFDYRLRPGVVPRGNGLVLLRLLGFEV